MPYADPDAKRAYDREYARRNAEKKRARARLHHAQNRNARNRAARERRAQDAGADRARCREWRDRNRGRKREADRAYYERNRERVKERIKRYVARNRERTNQTKERHRQVRQGGGRVAVRYRTILGGDICSYCFGAPAEEIDHIDPVSRGGTNDWSNLTASCRSCNARKRDRSLLLALLYPKGA